MDMNDFKALLEAKNKAERIYFRRCEDVYHWVRDGIGLDCSYVKEAIKKAEVAALALESAERDLDECFHREAAISTIKEG